MKDFIKNNGMIILQLVIIFFGFYLLISDSGGVIENMTFVSWLGIGLSIFGIGFQIIVSLTSKLIKKFFK